MSCPTITTIQPTECIGNSLNTINNNYQALKVGVCDNQDQINSLRTLLYNLSASVVPPAGSVINTHYVDLFGPQTRTGNTLDLDSFKPLPNFQTPTLTTGHEILTKTVALTNPNNYVIIQSSVSVTSDGDGQVLVMVFAGSTLIAAQTQEYTNYDCNKIMVKHIPGTTNNVTYSVRAAARTGYDPLQINQNYTRNGRYPILWPTGKQISSMLIQEIKG